MPLTIELETAAPERALGRLAETMRREGYPGAMKRCGRRLARAVRINVARRGRPPYPDIKDETKRRRRERARRLGRTLPAGDTPLRETDRMFQAATDTGQGRDGSAYKQGTHAVQVGPDAREVPYARYVVERRDFLTLPDDEARGMADELAVDVSAYARRFNAGKI